MNDQLDLLYSKSTEPRTLFFDLETKLGADDVGGWGYIHKMGMACGVLYDTSDNEFHVYEEADVNELISHLRKADLIVGFNHVGFDYRVLSGYSDVDFSSLPNFDILTDIKRILGHRLRLDSLAKATLGDAKSADGLQSLQWVKEGRLDLVREYCKKDVDVTRRLFEFGRTQGYVVFEKSGSPSRVPVDWALEKLIEAVRPEG